jgi:hypothetical protein
VIRVPFLPRDTRSGSRPLVAGGIEGGGPATLAAASDSAGSLLSSLLSSLVDRETGERGDTITLDPSDLEPSPQGTTVRMTRSSG